MDELDAGKGVTGEFNGLVKTALTTVRDIDNLEHLGLEALIGDGYKIIEAILLDQTCQTD